MYKLFGQRNTITCTLGVLGVILVCFVGMQIVFADTETSDISVEFQVGSNVCGDGVVDLGELCDDGNLSNTDACLNTCIFASCGDGFVRAGSELCDNGVSNGSCPSSCSNSCTPNTCGGGGSDPYPIVITTDFVASYNSMIVSWVATGGVITGCTVSWATNIGGPNVGSTNIYNEMGGVFSSTLSPLNSETLYYVTVSCTNNYGLQGFDTDSEMTTAAPVFLEKTITVSALAELRDTTPYQHENLDFVVRIIDPATGVPLADFSGVTNDSTGIYTGVHTIPVGTSFIAEIKGLSHLSKRIVGVDTTGGSVSLDFTDGGISRLRAGDVRAKFETNILPEYAGKSPFNDDIIEGADLSIVLSYFGTAGTSAYKILDFNRDGITPDYFITEGSELSTILSRFGTIVTYSL